MARVLLSDLPQHQQLRPQEPSTRHPLALQRLCQAHTAAAAAPGRGQLGPEASRQVRGPQRSPPPWVTARSCTQLSCSSSRQASTTRSLSWLLRPNLKLLSLSRLRYVPNKKSSSRSGIDLAELQPYINLYMHHMTGTAASPEVGLSASSRTDLSATAGCPGRRLLLHFGTCGQSETRAATAWEGSSAGHARGSEPPVRAMSPYAHRGYPISGASGQHRVAAGGHLQRTQASQALWAAGPNLDASSTEARPLAARGWSGGSSTPLLHTAEAPKPSSLLLRASPR